jgi:hypothetical protein
MLTEFWALYATSPTQAALGLLVVTICAILLLAALGTTVTRIIAIAKTPTVASILAAGSKQ